MYIPFRKGVYSRRKFESMDGCPEDWGYRRRLRIVATKNEREAERVMNVQQMSSDQAIRVVQQNTDDVDKERAIVSASISGRPASSQ